MKDKRADITQLVSKAIALFMLGVFSFILIAQAFHQHQSFGYGGDQRQDEAQVFAADKCKICVYLVHKQSKQAFIYHQPLVSAPCTKAITPLSRHYAGIYKFTLQGFSNKGPPAIMG